MLKYARMDGSSDLTHWRSSELVVYGAARGAPKSRTARVATVALVSIELAERKKPRVLVIAVEEWARRKSCAERADTYVASSSSHVRVCAPGVTIVSVPAMGAFGRRPSKGMPLKAIS